MSRRARWLAAALVVAGAAPACADSGDPAPEATASQEEVAATADTADGPTDGSPAAPGTTRVPAGTVPSTTLSAGALPTGETSAHPVAPDGRAYPVIPTAAADAATRLFAIETDLRELDPTDPAWADLAHEQQVLYRVIGRNPDWIPAVIERTPDELRPAVGRHLAARRAIAGIGAGRYEPPRNVPAWEIIEPLPLDELEALYRQAESDTGIEWTFLAAINFIETGFGRIDGISTAGAQGPMQFLPTTWEEVSDGDIRDPADAIPAAARYLVRRGGPDDMHRALWGYNNSDSYVAAVTHYATLFRTDRKALEAAHGWEIHYAAADGDLWFPVGYREEEPRPVAEYLLDAPWSAPPA